MLSPHTTHSILPNGILNNYGISNLISHLKTCMQSNNSAKFIFSSLIKNECIKLNSVERNNLLNSALLYLINTSSAFLSIENPFFKSSYHSA